MTKECYEELLAKVNSKYKEPKPGVFWCEFSKEWDFSFDITDVLPMWQELGFEWTAYDTEPDDNGKTNRRLDFLDADGKVVGHFLTIPGCGFYWEWPQLIVDILHYEEDLIDKCLEIQQYNEDPYTKEELLRKDAGTLRAMLHIHEISMRNRGKEVAS